MRSLLAVLLMFAPVSANSEFKVTPNVANTLSYLYDNLQVEFAFCAYGSKKNGVVTVDGIVFPFIHNATDSTIMFEPKTCPTKRLLGVGHSHPGEDSICDLSRIDIYSFLHGAWDYGFLMCQRQEFKVFVKTEVRYELVKRGLLAEALTPPWGSQ